jgi:hypothetical protein
MKKLLLACALLCVATSYSQIKFGLQLTGADLDIGKKLGLSGRVDNPLTPAPGDFVGIDLVDIYSFGFGGGAHLDVSLPVLFSFRLQGDYVTFMPSETKYRDLLVTILPGTRREDWLVEGGRINALSVFVNTKLSPLPLPVVSPYFTAGVGLANIARTDADVKYQGTKLLTIQGGDAVTNMLANAGIGADVNLIAISFFVEARATWVFTEDGTTSLLPLASLGVTF